MSDTDLPQGSPPKAVPERVRLHLAGVGLEPEDLPDDKLQRVITHVNRSYTEPVDLDAIAKELFS